jgi:iron-sulfur cluster repair protein YtfE (RIC family)
MPLRSTQTKTAGRQTSRRSASSLRESVLEMLKDDHKRVKKAFRDFEKLDPHEEPERCAEIVEQTCSELEIHAQLEEELFYPAVRENIADADLVAEAEVEHKSAKQLIADLKNMSPEDEKYAATFKVLGEYVKHHVREEEQEMFKQLERTKIDWSAMLEAMQSRRQEMIGEGGMAPEPALEIESPKRRAAPSRGRR